MCIGLTFFLVFIFYFTQSSTIHIKIKTLSIHHRPCTQRKNKIKQTKYLRRKPKLWKAEKEWTKSIILMVDLKFLDLHIFYITAGRLYFNSQKFCNGIFVLSLFLCKINFNPPHFINSFHFNNSRKIKLIHITFRI